MKDIAALLKKRLQMQGYGKYDLLEELFSKNDLLTRKPGILFFKTAEFLGEAAVYLKRKSFYSWLSRYRKQQIQRDTSNNGAWEDFVPTQIREQDARPDPLIIEFVKPR